MIQLTFAPPFLVRILGRQGHHTRIPNESHGTSVLRIQMDPINVDNFVGLLIKVQSNIRQKYLKKILVAI